MGLSTLHISPFPSKATQGDAVSDFLERHRNAVLLGDQRYYVSLADGLIRESAGTATFEAEEAYIELAIGGHLVTVKPERPPPMTGHDLSGGKRGEITGYSRGSRRRLMRLIAGTEKDKRPIFATLTYPDVFPNEMAKWKRDIDVLGKRIRRKMPDVGFIWRIEFVNRKSGVSKGKIAPHFHLLLWGVDQYTFRKFLGPAWYSVVGSEDSKHELAGTKVERLKGWRGVMAYVSKYVAKEDYYPPEWRGRVWGIISKENIPFAIRVIIPLTRLEGVKLVRLGRKFCGLRGKTLVYGLTWLMDAESVLDYLEYLVGCD